MFETLKYSVTFPTNGKTMSGEVTYSPGVTAVTGANWSGKTFGSIEMPRYLLFGKEALRGPASDYKTLNAEGWVRIAGVRYFISRTPKKEELRDENDELLAVNAKAVNQKIVELLGFNLDVFDLVCAARQKDSDRLSSMRPTARKQLIDEVLGLTALETIEKECKEKAKEYRQSAESLERHLREPVKVEQDPKIRPALVVQAEYEAVRSELDMKHSLELIVAKRRERPETPEGEQGDTTELETWEKERQAHEAVYQSILTKLGGLDDPEYTEQQLEVAEAILHRGPRPTSTLDELDAAERDWDLFGLADVELECPKCTHVFRTGQHPEPDLTRKQIADERRAHENWPDELVGPVLSLVQIRQAREALKKVSLEKELEEAKRGLMVDKSEQLLGLQKANRDWEAYQRNLPLWEALEEEVLEAEAKLLKITATDNEAETLRGEMVLSRLHEQAQASYAEKMAYYEEDLTEVRVEREKADEFSAGAKALSEARVLVKAFLAPSLSRVASSLISQMTAGKMQEIIVDEDMNITVDGQEANTLSGAGSTLANLALRIGLGQVLVARVFPVFIGDELDADMDAENAQATADALYLLREQLDQIILITHKQIDQADAAIAH